MSNHDELIAQFVEISGADENAAKFYLSSAEWSLETAIATFLGAQSEGDGEPFASNVADTSTSAGEVKPTAMNSAQSSRGDFANKSSAKPKFATLNDMKQKSDDEEEGQAFYAGGSDRSGQQILGPPQRKNFREQLSDMFRMAQEQGSDDVPTPSTSSGVTWGQGMRLGMTDTDHSVVDPRGGATKNKAKKPIVILKLWSQGFSIDDGELRLYDDPENKEFLETVMRGEIPQELLEKGWMVNVDVEDHRHEDFKKTIPTPSFKGSGYTLGSPAPNIIGAEVSKKPSATSPVDSENNEKLAKEKLHLNSSEPTTTLQIRLADGSRIAAEFNLSHTVADIYQYIQDARPQYADTSFRLMSSFPVRELADNTITIEGAGLKNAAIMQRLS